MRGMARHGGAEQCKGVISIAKTEHFGSVHAGRESDYEKEVDHGYRF